VFSGEGKPLRERTGGDELGREVGLQSVENRLTWAERRDVGGNVARLMVVNDRIRMPAEIAGNASGSSTRKST